MAPADPAAIARALQLEEALLADARAPEIARLLHDRPEFTAKEAADLYTRACVRLGPRGWAAVAAGRAVPGSDPPYADILAWVNLIRPQMAALAADHPRGGPPPGEGLTWERVVEAAVAGEEPDGTCPTEDAVAIALGRSARRIRQVVGPRGGWPAVVRAVRATPRG